MEWSMGRIPLYRDSQGHRAILFQNDPGPPVHVKIMTGRSQHPAEKIRTFPNTPETPRSVYKFLKRMNGELPPPKTLTRFLKQTGPDLHGHPDT
jgi:hypothetical protein